MCKDRLDRFAQFAENVLLIPHSEDLEQMALLGIQAMEDYFRSIGMPTSLHKLGIAPSEEQILELADKCSFGNTRTIGKVRELNREHIALPACTGNLILPSGGILLPCSKDMDGRNPKVGIQGSLYGNIS